MGKNIISFILLLVSTITIIIMAFMIFQIKSRSQLKNVFICIIVLVFTWNIGTIFELLIRLRYGHTEMIFVNICYFSICFLPIAILMLGIIYAHTHIKISLRYMLLFLMPIVSTILIWTNGNHGLFFVKYSVNSREALYGSYFYIHSVYSYICIFIGISYMVVFSVKNSGFFSKQSLFIILGVLAPLIVNMVFTFNLADIPFMANSIAFTFFGLFIMIAMFKFDFLNIMPIAMQTVVDRISDSFVVVDRNFRIIDYNRTMIDTFSPIAVIKRKRDLFQSLKFLQPVAMEIFKRTMEKVTATKESVAFEKHFKEKSFNKYFSIEITPIISNDNWLGTIVLLKDITEHKENLRTIGEQQRQIADQEKLASLGTLIGGISHNLKTPIMSISGCIIAFEDLTEEYLESIGNTTVTDTDHREIALDMQNNLRDLKNHVSYMSNALTAIKNQVVNPDTKKESRFTLGDVILNIEFLMKYEIKANYCTLSIKNNVEQKSMIKGDIGTLVQVINNLISNAIQAYEKNTDAISMDVSKRKIELMIFEEENYIVFQVRDRGKGVAKEVKDKLFKEMVTTKGKEGNGIGLYLSSSKVKVMFNGDMWFESEEGKGTSFYVKIKAFENV